MGTGWKENLIVREVSVSIGSVKSIESNRVYGGLGFKLVTLRPEPTKSSPISTSRQFTLTMAACTNAPLPAKSDTPITLLVSTFTDYLSSDLWIKWLLWLVKR